MKKLLSLVLASLFATAAAQAGVVSYSSSYGPDLTDWDPAQTLSLQKFDSALGTLNSVSFQFDGSMTSTFSAKNTGKRSRTFTSVLGGTLDFMLPTLQTFGLTISASDSGSVAANTGFSQTLSDSDSLTETLFGDLSTFIGAGSFNLGVLALATSQFAASGNVNSSVETQAYASAQVTYDYSPQRRSVRLAVPQQAVPEPGSLLLVALALGAAAMSRRRA